MVELPLALRTALPAIVNNLVNLVKLTTIGYAVAVNEITYASLMIWTQRDNVVESDDRAPPVLQRHQPRGGADRHGGRAASGRAGIRAMTAASASARPSAAPLVMAAGLGAAVALWLVLDPSLARSSSNGCPTSPAASR